MKIGIDISQIVHEGTGVARYVRAMVTELLRKDLHNEYVLFGASLRKQSALRAFFGTLGTGGNRVRLVIAPIPPTVLAFLWNRLHWVPIEWFIGPVDIFWSSDWVQPPLSRAIGVTTVHDISFLKVSESFAPGIIAVQKQRLYWVAKECRKIFCDSHVTQNDLVAQYDIATHRTVVIYPGI